MNRRSNASERQNARLYNRFTRIGLPFLANMQRSLVDTTPGTQISCQTESGTLYSFRQADGYAMTINGVTRSIRITTTQVGYGIRQWYVCPHCVKRVAKLYIGSKDIGCRECWKLHYKSQSGDRLDRMRMNIRRQRVAIWGDGERVLNLLLDPIINNMNHLEGMDWAEIENMISDSGLRMHHGHDITDLCNDAIGRWFELGYAQFEMIFRFRLGNTKRAWGIELQGHFYLIWYEREHNI